MCFFGLYLRVKIENGKYDYECFNFKRSYCEL